MNQTDYLDKVVDHLVDETTIEGRIVLVPYSKLHQVVPLIPIHPTTSSFTHHVTKVYGLTEEEVKYVWKQYRSIIHDKI